MNFEIYESSLAHEIKELFTNVFTNSEGQAEGDLIGNLAFELQETTNPEDLFGFVARDGQNVIGCVFLHAWSLRFKSMRLSYLQLQLRHSIRIKV